MATPVTPETTKLFDTPIPPKRKAVAIQQGTNAYASLQLVDAKGDPLDLSSYYGNASYTVQGNFRDSVPQQDNIQWEIGNIVSPGTDGQVTVNIPKWNQNNPGIYILEVAITDDTIYHRASVNGEIVQSITSDTSNLTITTTSASYLFPVGSSPIVGVGDILIAKQQFVRNVQLVLSNTFYLAIERGLFGTPDQEYVGPPSIAEVRLHLRDYPENNLLLDEYEFDEAEIAMAAERCIMYFNELMPPIQRKFSTRNFPFRYHWLEGITYYLFMIAANWHRRNRLPYQAGGVSVDDIGKEKDYMQAAMMYEKNWKEWAIRQKVSLNMEEGFAFISSDYSWR